MEIIGHTQTNPTSKVHVGQRIINTIIFIILSCLTPGPLAQNQCSYGILANST